MKTTDFIVESIGQDADEMHRDHEVQMARADCYNAAKYAIELHKILHHIAEEQGLEGWVSEKITLANDYLRTVYEHLTHEMAMKQQDELPAFTFESAEKKMAALLEGPLHNPGEQQSPVAQAITHRILRQRTDLLAKHGPEAVGRAIDLVADFVGDVEEIGSSDVSAWVKYVEGELGEPVEEGRFVKGPGGVPLDRRGNPIPPKAPKVKPVADTEPKLTLDGVWRQVENVSSMIYPDGDPIDHLAPWLEKHGIYGHKIGEVLNRAAKKHGYSDMYEYYHSLGNDLGYDREVAESEQDLSKASAKELRSQIAKIVSAVTRSKADREQLMKLQAELKRREQGVAEGLKFNGGFPDVDHMPGAVHRNHDMATDNVHTTDKAQWDRAVDSINAKVFDDMAEFRSDSKGERVTGNSAVWAVWDNAKNAGWFNSKGRPLKPWPVKEEGMDKEELQAKRKELQRIQMDPSTAHDPQLKAALARRKAELEKQADSKKQTVSEMTAGGTGAGAVATAINSKGGKPGTGVPKKVNNIMRRVAPKIGKGIY